MNAYTKFDVWIGVAFLSDNATRPVERAAEMRQAIQVISVEINSLNWIRHGRRAACEPGLRYEDIINHRSYAYNLSRCEIKAWKNSGLNGIRTHDLRDTGAVL